MLLVVWEELHLLTEHSIFGGDKSSWRHWRSHLKKKTTTKQIKNFTLLTWQRWVFGTFCFWSVSWSSGLGHKKPDVRLVPRHSQMQRGHVRMEKIRKGHWGCFRHRVGSTHWRTVVDNSTSRKKISTDLTYDRPRSGQPRDTTCAYDHHMKTVRLRDRSRLPSARAAETVGAWKSHTATQLFITQRSRNKWKRRACRNVSFFFFHPPSPYVRYPPWYFAGT